MMRPFVKKHPWLARLVWIALIPVYVLRVWQGLLIWQGPAKKAIVYACLDWWIVFREIKSKRAQRAENVMNEFERLEL